jgi:outer membrane protein TolC
MGRTLPLRTSIRAALLVTVAASLAGCAATAIRSQQDAVAAFAERELGVPVRWNTDPERRAAAEAEVEQLLAGPLSADDAVRIALGYSPKLQAMLAMQAQVVAEAVQTGRPPNPLLTYERVEGDVVEIDRKLALSVLDLLLWPSRASLSSVQRRQASLRGSAEVLEVATATRSAWIEAVAAAQSAAYATQVLEAAEAGAELARRMKQVGNYSRIEEAREELFLADARAELARARLDAQQKREQLVRLLGLRTALAERLTLPERLPDLPAAPQPAEELARRAFDERLDVALARAELDATARELGLTRVTGTVDVFEAAAVRKTAPGERETGWEADLRLPVFDWGDARRSGARARYLGSLERTALVAVEAQSMLRESHATYATAWQIAANYRDEVLPLRRAVSEQNLLLYNGMLISVFELLADAREQISAVRQAIGAQRDFWLAEAALRATTIGLPQTGPALATPAPASGGSAPAAH